MNKELHENHEIDASELFLFSAVGSPQPLNEGGCTSS